MSELHKISGCDEADRQADVIFLHGLGGDAFKTWQHGDDPSDSWPHWMGEEFPQVGIWSLGYAASPTKRFRLGRRFLRRKSPDARDTGHAMALPTRAGQVLDLMVRTGLGERPILLICHSLGGLLAKQILRSADDSPSDRKKAVYANTRAVLFLATPHTGADIASKADAFRTILGTTVSIEDLRAHDAHLLDLYNWYRNHSAHIGTVTYYETRDLCGVRIVKAAFAHPGVGANPVGLDEDHLSIVKPPQASEQVCCAARDLMREIVLPPPTSRRPEGSPATPRNLPERQRWFAGRESELTELHERLSQHVEVGITQQAAVHAHGGVGKTALAVEYAWRHLEDFPGGQYFLACGGESGPLALHELAQCMGEELEGETSDETAGRVKERLEGGERSLLILDNVRDAAQWKDEAWSKYLPGGNCCRVITTRTELLPGVEMYPLLRLTPEDGRALLEQYRPDVSENEKVVARVVEWFDGLAVGLTVVGAYMTVRDGLTWEQYAASLEAKGFVTVRATEDEVGPLPDYDARVDSVFDDLLDELDESERRALEYCALLPADQVHRVWLTELLEGDETVELTEPPGFEGDASGAVLGALTRQRILVSRVEGEDVLSVHRVLLRRLNERLDEAVETRDGLLDQVVALAERRGEASHSALTDRSLRQEWGACSR